MKKTFFACLCFGFFAVASAQNQFVATLQHGDEVSNYYGSDALKKAYNASETGDVITLSSGAFNSCNIEKGITVRGAGLNSELKTEVNGNIRVYSTDESWTTTFEGLKLNSTVCVYSQNAEGAGKVVFEKNYINDLRTDYSSPTESGTPTFIVNSSYINNLHIYAYTKFTAYNSIMRGDNSTDRSDYTNPTFYNCLFIGYMRSLSSANLNNCIFYNTYNSYYGYLPTSAVATNCLSINPNSYSAFTELPAGANINNSMETDITEIFKTFTGEFTSFAELYELTEKGKSYKGIDGTEVGVQGGFSPYSLHVQYPVISKFQADSKAGTDGKLNVTIEVTNGK